MTTLRLAHGTLCCMPELHTLLESALGTRYRIERKLGGRGMTRVFAPEEMRFGRTVVTCQWRLPAKSPRTSTHASERSLGKDLCVPPSGERGEDPQSDELPHAPSLYCSRSDADAYWAVTF